MQNTRKVGGGGAPTIWKVAIYGAGKSQLNAEYSWNGTILENGNRKYYESNLENYIFWTLSEWALYDNDFSEIGYISSNLITWQSDNAPNPAPTSALSYSQSSYIQTIVLGGADADQTGTYTWNGTTFIDGKPKYMGPLKTGAPENNYIYYSSGDGVYYLYGFKTSTEAMISLSSSIDLVSTWLAVEGSSDSNVSSITYTA